jgi:hypothetical protein
MFDSILVVCTEIFVVLRLVSDIYKMLPIKN